MEAHIHIIMNTLKLTSIAGLLSVASLSAFEGGYDYKDLLKNGGTFYSDSDNPFIQKARFYGRAQYQVATVFNDSESYNAVELRRTRLGAEIKFLNNFKFKGNADLENGGTNSVDFGGFTGWDDAGISADLLGLFDIQGFDKLSLTVGKKKIKIGQDVHTSSTKIKTIERSRLTDGKLRPANSTGVLLSGETSGIGFDLGYFSNVEDSEFDWWQKSNGAGFVYASTEFAVGNGDFIIDGVFTTGDEGDIDGDAATSLDYGWSVAYVTEFGDITTVFNVAGGEELDGDSFFGGTVLAYTNLTEQLEIVGRLSYFDHDSDAEANSRYARDLDKFSSGVGLDGGTSAFSAYAGLNYYFIGDNAKVMVGVDYDQVDGAGLADDSAITLSAAYRMKF